MLTWSKPNSIVPDEPLRWILTTLRFYTIIATVGIASAFAVISILSFARWELQHILIETGQVDRTKGGPASMVILIAMVILFGGAAYFTGRLYGKAGMLSVFAGFVVIVLGLLALRLSFS
jgi:hypothetical protein